MTDKTAMTHSSLWGGLRPGTHAVGFTTGFSFDAARDYGKTYSDRAEKVRRKQPRPILIHRWYPAEPSSNEPMLYEEYLNLQSNDPGLKDFIERLVDFNLDVISREVLGRSLKVLGPAEKEAFDRLMKTPTTAVKGAAPAAGRYPLVLYHPGLGGSFEDNAVLFEYLASHGYGVISSAYPSGTAARINIDWDLDRSFRDLECLVNAVAGETGVDLHRVAAMGHSFGGQAALAWQSLPNSIVDAVVSLDATIEYAPPDHPSVKEIWERIGAVEQMTTPLLVFAQAAGNPRFNNYDPLRVVVSGRRMRYTSKRGTYFWRNHDSDNPSVLPLRERSID